MASVRDIRKRIKSVKSTQKITKAMKMVAAARLRRSQEAAEQSNAYGEAIDTLLSEFSNDEKAKSHPLIRSRNVQKRLLIIFSSDRGLCGSFNSALFKRVEKELSQSDLETKVALVGRKAISYFPKRGAQVWKVLDGFWNDFSHDRARDFAQELTGLYEEGEFDQVDIAYNFFVSVINQEPKVEKLLPLQSKEVKELSEASEEKPKQAVFEPGREKILSLLIPRAIEVRMYRPCLHSQASEFGARMAAMDSASRNAGEMIDDLTLTSNRLRQANITSELVEIISGAEALK